MQFERDPRAKYFWPMANSQVGATPVPVTQMLSESHNIPAISYWLNLWTRCGVPAPKVVVSDFSKALLGACSRAFTACDLDGYVLKCAKVVSGGPESLAELPETCLRVDIAHFIKIFAQWKGFIGKSKRMKEFYMRCVGQLVQVPWNRFCSILFHLIRVGSSETQLAEGGLVRESKQYLTTLISGTSVDLGAEDSEMRTGSDTQAFGIVGQGGQKFKDMIGQATSGSLSEEVTQEGEEDNAHFFPEFVEHLITYFPTAPLWSAIMCDYFGHPCKTASSATVENYFNHLKTHVFANVRLPIRADHFLVEHMNSIGGQLKIEMAASEKVIIVHGTDPLQTVHDINQSIVEESSTVENSNCPLCSKGLVSVAHKCGRCFRAVHAIPQCSLPLGDSDEQEGFGSSRLCLKCAKRSAPEVTGGTEDKNATENWRGKGAIIHKKRGSYLQTKAAWACAEPSLQKKVGLGILKNGNLMQNPTKGATRVLLSNTCAFDAVLHAMVAAYCDSEAYKSSIETFLDQNAALKLVDYIAKRKIDQHAYCERAKIIQSWGYLTEQLHGGLSHIKC